MNRLVVLGLVTLGYLAGFYSNAGPSIPAHASTVQASQPQAPAFPPRTLYWSAETIRRAHAEMASRAAAGKPGGSTVVSVRTPTHGMNLLHRSHHAQPVPSNTQKIMSLWDDAEAHSSLSEFLLIVGGSGTMVVDGTIENQVELKERPGEFRGQPIKNGTSYKLKEGDWLVIPPNTPHWPQPDPGGLSYLRMTINLSPIK